MSKLKRLLALMCAAVITATALPPLELPASAETEETAEITEDAELTEESSDIPEEPQYMFTLPKNMRASVITPGADFATGGTTDSEAVQERLTDIFTDFSEIGLNTVIINTVYEENSYYNLDMNDESSFDPTALALSTAYNFGI